jgi:sec-independent protein translocase protein TatA
VFHPSPMHLLILVAVVLLVLGPKRVPQMARSLGGALREMRGSLGDDDADDRRDALVEARQETPAPTPEVAEADAVARREAARAGS